ncbi:MAG: TonB-dependent receptor [candidate division Zixibacteria bacterium]|nr:TonB-dependent receptor [candidate division Zixibacteria bacterium]
MTGLAKRFLIWMAILLMLLISVSSIFAGSTGKIKGLITDKDTGEPIPGASILITQTKQGAMTDPDGKYLITLVPPSAYILKVTSISYSSVEVSEVFVSTDQTTEVNVKMEKAVKDLGLVIRVTADKDIIEKTVTSSVTKFSRETISAMPVTKVDELLKQAAGIVTTSAGEIIIRGGRAGEVAYIVDGVSISDPLGGYGPVNLGLSLTSGSIQEISIIKDGFDPEYGNALSGIVKITTQTGSPEKTRMMMQYMTDDFGNSKLNKYSQNYDDIYFTIGGPDPILRSKILPALKLNFLEDKELTYYFFAEMNKQGTPYSYDKYTPPTTAMKYRSFNLLGIRIPERQYNDYSINSNIMMKPTNSMKVILSYKSSVTRQTDFDWQYLYTPNTAPVYETKWQSYAMELTHQISKNMHYYLRASYYNRDLQGKPGDPNNPGKGLDPDQFLRYYEYEKYNDYNKNGVYDPGEPIINIVGDSMEIGSESGQSLYGPKYTTDEDTILIDAQIAGPFRTNFRFNDGSRGTNLEGEPFADMNGNGRWDAGDWLYDTDGDGIYDPSRRQVINQHTPEPYIDGDINLGEPFTDANHNGVYDYGVDGFVESQDPATNQDINRNSRYTGPNELWSPGIPFIDLNGNGIFDYPNGGLYESGDPYTDVNGNGRYDYGGQTNFFDIGNYESGAVWHHRRVQQYVLEGRIYRQLGVHELKGGGELMKEYILKQDIRGIDQVYNGTDDNGIFPGLGELRDFYKYEPLSGSFYLRDNLEYGSMIASLGFRYDFFIQTMGLEEVAKSDDLGSGLIKGDRTRFSPRLGFSYPISDKAKIHFNYGHFYQLPDYSYMYDRNTASASANDVVGNYNLDYQKTIQYSFGIKYAMSADYSIDVSGYFKDEFDKINSANVKLGGGGLTVQRYENRDYGRSRGFEIEIDKRGGRLINGQVNYTYAFAYGKQSQTRNTYWTDFELSRESLSEKPLDNDIRHSLKCGIQLVIPETKKPRLFGLRIPNGWTLGVQGTFETGRPFTPGSKYPNLRLAANQDVDGNSLRGPSALNFDVKFEKYFKMVSLNWRFIISVKNLLDNRNAQSIFTNTGRADTRQSDSYNITGGTDYDRNPKNWQLGRQIQFGMQVSL